MIDKPESLLNSVTRSAVRTVISLALRAGIFSRLRYLGIRNVSTASKNDAGLGRAGGFIVRHDGRRISTHETRLSRTT